jgi:hypothetical protein
MSAFLCLRVCTADLTGKVIATFLAPPTKVGIRSMNWKKARSINCVGTTAKLIAKAADVHGLIDRASPGDSGYRLDPKNVVDIFKRKEPELTLRWHP